MLPRWLLRLAALVVLLGLVLYATAGQCAEPQGDAAVAAQLGALRAEVVQLRDQMSRLVQAQERALERRPAYEADVRAAGEAWMRELQTTRTEQERHGARLTALEEARWYLLGVAVVLLAVGGALWKNYRLEVRREHEPRPPPQPPVT